MNIIADKFHLQSAKRCFVTMTATLLPTPEEAATAVADFKSSLPSQTQIAPSDDEIVLPTIAREATADGWTGLMAGFAPAPTDDSTTNSGDTGGPTKEQP
jgi:hypothetical protein